MSAPLTVALAQIDPRLGDLAGNLELHHRRIATAREAGARLLVFPELSLTGYRLLHLTAGVALPAAAPELEELARSAGPMDVLAGFVEAGADGHLYNSVAHLGDGRLLGVQRKIHLPTYGLFQESRFFAPGRRLEAQVLAGEPGGVLICEDLWHPPLARRMARSGARLLVVASAAPGRVGAGPAPDNQQNWELLTRSTALTNGCWVLYCNRVGFEEGAFYSGGSHVVDPAGRITDRAPALDDHLLMATIDREEVARVRRRTPLLAGERLEVEGPRS